eukprot:4852085-Amphidinium_carterae.2
MMCSKLHQLLCDTNFQRLGLRGASTAHARAGMAIDACGARIKGECQVCTSLRSMIPSGTSCCILGMLSEPI